MNVKECKQNSGCTIMIEDSRMGFVSVKEMYHFKPRSSILLPEKYPTLPIHAVQTLGTLYPESRNRSETEGICSRDSGESRPLNKSSEKTIGRSHRQGDSKALVRSKSI